MKNKFKILMLACVFAILPAIMFLFAGCKPSEFEISFSEGTSVVTFKKEGLQELFMGESFSANSRVTLDIYSTNQYDPNTLVIKNGDEILNWEKSENLDETLVNNNTVKIGTITFENLNKNIVLSSSICEKNVMFNFALKTNLSEEQKQIASLFTLDDVAGNPTLLYASQNPDEINISYTSSQWSVEKNSRINLSCKKSLGYFVGENGNVNILSMFLNETNISYDYETSKWFWSLSGRDCKTQNTLTIDTSEIARPTQMSFENKIGSLISIGDESGVVGEITEVSKLSDGIVLKFTFINLDCLDLSNAKLYLYDTELDVTKKGSVWTFALNGKMPFDFLSNEHKSDSDYLVNFNATKYEFKLRNVSFGDNPSVSMVKFKTSNLGDAVLEWDKDYNNGSNELYRDYENNTIYLASTDTISARGVMKFKISNYPDPKLIIQGSGNSGSLKSDFHYLKNGVGIFKFYNQNEMARENNGVKIIAGFDEIIDENTEYDFSKVTYFIIELPEAPKFDELPALYQLNWFVNK